MPSTRLLLVVGLVVVLLAYFSMLVSGGGLKMDGFADLAPKSNVFTLYYMNGCPHCERIMPAYKKFAAAGQFETNGKKVKLRALEQADPSAGPEIEARNITGFPTFVLSTAAGEFLEYKGERSIEAMTQFIKENAS